MRWLFSLLCVLASANLQAEAFEARVIAVLDGDTLLVLRGQHKLKVRLANIDAPEKEQAYGAESRQSLLALADKRHVRIDSQAVDQYGRVIGLVSVDGLSLNQEQVRRGMAWEYSYRHSDKTYLPLQGEAQQARRGLWAQTDPLAPWLWRKEHASDTPHRAPPPVARDMPMMLYDLQCGKKRRCSEMTSCDEARFYLERCGVKPLDGNRDGEPCEALCTGKGGR